MGRLFAFLILVLITPAMLLAASVLAFCYGKNPFYSQIRVGKNKVPFRIYKLRTMRGDNDPSILTHLKDERITRAGRFLRRYKIDELPQLWNILRREMNWVGPRPEQPVFVERLVARSPSFDTLYRVRPGLTSLGIVRFGYAENTRQMARRALYDKYYLQHPSFRLKIGILALTFGVVCRGKGR